MHSGALFLSLCLCLSLICVRKWIGTGAVVGVGVCGCWLVGFWCPSVILFTQVMLLNCCKSLGDIDWVPPLYYWCEPCPESMVTYGAPRRVGSLNYCNFTQRTFNHGISTPTLDSEVIYVCTSTSNLHKYQKINRTTTALPQFSTSVTR